MGLLFRRPSGQVDGDVGGVGEDVVDRRALLRLRDEGLDLLGGGVSVDRVAHPDAAEAVADFGIGTQDSVQIMLGLDRLPAPNAAESFAAGRSTRYRR